MPISRNAIIMGASGTFGKQMVFKRYGDKTVIANVPDFSKRKLTLKQVRNTEVMTQANDFAQAIIANEETRNAAQIRLNVPRNKLYTSLIREYYQENYNKEKVDISEVLIASLNKPFVTYLLQNTDKSVQEIAQLTNSTPEIIAKFKLRLDQQL